MEVYAKSDRGKVRDQNQDFFYVPDKDLGIGLYILADGMGGYNGGNIASALAVAAAKSYIINNYEITFDNKEDIKRLVNGALEYANMIVSEKAKEDEALKEMGSTLELVLVIKDDLYIAHAGDSRVYRMRKGILRKLTKDHTYVQKLVLDGKITKQESITHPEKNKITKAVGMNSLVEGDIIVRKFLKGDTLLLCSDGLTNMLTDQRIKEILSLENEDVAKILVDEANNNGGTDNITAIVVKK